MIPLSPWHYKNHLHTILLTYLLTCIPTTQLQTYRAAFCRLPECRSSPAPQHADVLDVWIDAVMRELYSGRSSQSPTPSIQYEQFTNQTFIRTVPPSTHYRRLSLSVQNHLAIFLFFTILTLESEVVRRCSAISLLSYHIIATVNKMQ